MQTPESPGTSTGAAVYNFPAGYRGDRLGSEQLFRRRCRVGTRAPDFIIRTLDKNIVRFSEFASRYEFTMLEFGSIT